MPKVSVIVPVYNAERYLAQCVDSILAQTLQDMQVILVDDGSTDSSPGDLRRLCRKRPARPGHSQGQRTGGLCPKCRAPGGGRRIRCVCGCG